MYLKLNNRSVEAMASTDANGCVLTARRVILRLELGGEIRFGISTEHLLSCLQHAYS